MVGEVAGPSLFAAQLSLLRSFLAHRGTIAGKIQELLAAQRDVAATPAVTALARQIEDCFFTLAGLPASQLALRGQLQAAHWASGFRPRAMPPIPNDLADPAEMLVRGCHLWRQTRWPGRNGRLRFAHTLFNLFLLRALTLLSVRIWDDGDRGAGERLEQIQRLLDALWQGAPGDQPVLLRDARWLLPMAQSPVTDEMAGYFRIAGQVAVSLPDAQQLEIHRATVQLAGGHLRSQLRHYCLKQRVGLDDSAVLLSSRASNALDFALTVQSLVPLLISYERAIEHRDLESRRTLASAICQGISSDPELFVNQPRLLAAYCMIEPLFVTDDAQGPVRYSAIGLRQVSLLQTYAALIDRLAATLASDSIVFQPRPGCYSPYGIIYGFAFNLLEHMVLKSLQPDAERRFSLEDVFSEDGSGAAKLAWVDGWRKLPHVSPEVQRLFDYPQEFAEAAFARVAQALQWRAVAIGRGARTDPGRLILAADGGADRDTATSAAALLPADLVRSSDPAWIDARRALPWDNERLLRERQEGMYLVSFPSGPGWVGLSKDLLTQWLQAGKDVRVTGLPASAAAVLRLTAPELVVEASAV